MAMLEAENVSKEYSVENRRIRVLQNVTLRIEAGEFVVIQGASGSGKTTLLSLLSGLDYPTSGRIRLEGEDITDLGEDDLAPLRNESIGFVFQSFHLIPSLTASENVAFPAEMRRDADAGNKAAELLTQIGMKDRLNNFPHQLSGGEKQRVAICRALINRPKVLFADEPTGNLDSENSAAILKLLRNFHRRLHATLVLVTHSAKIAASADRVIHLHDGRIHEDAGAAA